MLKRLLLLGVTGGLTLATSTARAQTPVTLGATSPYLEQFTNLGTALPAGFGVYTAATATALGTAATPTLTPGTATAWSSTTGGYKNFASANSLAAGVPTATQTAATDRALGVRQVSATDAGVAFVFAIANTTGKQDFALSYKLQSLDETSPRLATWQVSYGIGATPTTFTNIGPTATTGDQAFSNNTVQVDFQQFLDNNPGPIWIRIASLNGTTGSGNRPSSAIDDFSLSWNTISATAPAITATPNTLAFAGQNINTASTAQTYTLTGANLTAATTLTVTGPFTISKDNTTYATTLSYTAADLATAKTVYVKFTPTATGPFTGSISHASTGATTRTVSLTGIGKDPNQTTFDFATCSSTTAISDGWSQYSVTGAQTWACTTFGRDPNAPTGTTASPYGVQMNGYSSGNIANEDWLISPAFNLTTYNYPLFSFWSRTAFSGPALKLRVSTNYSGTGDPTTATWTDLNAQFPGVGSDTWTSTAGVNLSAYKQANVYVAFVYTSTTAGAARWTLDDIALTNSATPPAPKSFTDQTSVAFGYQAINTNGDRTLTVAASDLTGPVTLTSSNPAFTLSKDGTTFGSTLSLTLADVNNTSKVVTVRFRPTTASTSYSASVAITTAGTTIPSVALTGDTYDVANTLELVNWNLEWFGSTAAGLGPTDKALQQTNVTAVMTALKADVYAVEEVVDVTRLASVVTQLSTTLGVPYAYAVSDFGSYADDAADTDYAGAQKLAFIYRTDIISNPTFTGLLRCSQATACPAYTPWASGRFPYMMTANVTLNGVTKAVNFIVIHAKANATASSANDYARRQTGSVLLKNLLDTTYPTANTVIVGDYNDVLNGTIATGVTPAVSSYDNFVQDVANYTPISLALSQAGLQSTVSYKTVIDNVIANKNMGNYYINGTAAIRIDATSAISNYANTTSDHYPVFTRYSFSTVTATTSSNRAALGLYPNPVTNTVRFEVPETGSNLSLQVHTIDGRLILSSTGSVEQLNQQLGQRVGSLGTGLYLIQVVGAKQTYVNRFVKQ